MTVLLTVVGALVVLVLLIRQIRRAEPVPPAELPPRLGRRLAAYHWGGVLLGVLLAVAAIHADRLGRGLMLAAPLFGIGLLTGVVVGQLLTRPAVTGPRTAAVEVREPRRYLPGGLTRAVGTAAALVTVLLIFTTAAGSADDQHRSGRSFERICGDVTSRRGPWPGAYYSVPLAIVLVIGLAVAVLALRALTNQPRPGVDHLAGDDALRRRTAESVVAATGILVTLPLAGVSLTAAGALLTTGYCSSAWEVILGWALLAIMPTVVVLFAWCIATVLGLRSRVVVSRP